MKPPVAIVKWKDASRTDDVVNPAAMGPVIRETVGWLLSNGPEGVVIAMTNDDGTYERGFFIPREYIQKVRKLR